MIRAFVVPTRQKSRRDGAASVEVMHDWATRPAHSVTNYAYDTEGNLSSITDANNHTMYFTYNARGA